VLIVSCHFPPANNIAAVRIGKFAKYLPEFGWEPIVLTNAVDKKRPQTLPVEVPEANIIRVPHLSLGISNTIYRGLGGEDNSYAASPWANVNWKRALLRLVRMTRPIYTFPLIERLRFELARFYFPGVRKGLEIINNCKIDLIFSTYSPSTTPLIASRLHSKTGIPWVADFRDLWLDPRFGKGQLYQFFNKKLEKKINRGASILVGATEPISELLEAIHSKKAATITNGFDETDYQESVPLLPKFTLTYTGNIYSGKRDLTPLFEALKELRDEGKISHGNFEVRFFGGNSLNFLPPLIKNYHLEDIVSVYGFIPFKESIKKQKETTVLLLLEWDNPLAGHVYTGKIFEYLGASRPILAIAFKGGIINELLNKSGCGKVVTEVNEIKALLTKWLQEFAESGNIKSYFNPDVEIIKCYTRREQTRKLAQVFDELTQGKILSRQ